MTIFCVLWDLSKSLGANLLLSESLKRFLKSVDILRSYDKNLTRLIFEALHSIPLPVIGRPDKLKELSDCFSSGYRRRQLQDFLHVHISHTDLQCLAETRDSGDIKKVIVTMLAGWKTLQPNNRSGETSLKTDHK